MIKVKLKIFTLICFFVFNSCASESNMQFIDDRLNSLLSKMTLEEKIGQMNQYSSFWDVTGPAPKEGSTAKQFELKRFELIDLKPNQTKTVRFTLTEDALGFYDDDGNFTVQPGEFSIYVGGDSTANLTTKFNL